MVGISVIFIATAVQVEGGLMNSVGFEPYEFWVISAFSAAALIIVAYRMKGGFGPQNLRAFGIALVATLVAMLAAAKGSELATAMGILGAIAGYLFGSQRDSEPPVSGDHNVNASGATFGDNAKLAGRDINEILQEIEGGVGKIQDSVVNLTGSSELTGKSDFLFISDYFDQGEPLERIARGSTQIEARGWRLKTIFPSHDKRGFITVFTRPAHGELSKFYHGLDEVELTE